MARPHIPRVRAFWLAALVSTVPLSHPSAQELTGPLVVYNAGSLAIPFQQLLAAFATQHPGVRPAQENSGSLAAARKITDLRKVPDVIALADYRIFPELLIPTHATWYATVATNALALIYGEHSAARAEITPENWYRILQRPGVRWGRAEPTLDPAGYRALMAFQLAETYYHSPGLAARLLDASPSRFVRSKSADLVALIQLGELDYAWTYASIAAFHRLPTVPLPPELTFSDPGLGAWYDRAAVRLPGTGDARDSIEIRGEPIFYALTIPRAAPHPQTAEAFVRFVYSAEGRAILARAHLPPVERPVAAGPGAPPRALQALFARASRPEP